MADSRISRSGWAAIGLAIVGGILALGNQAMRYQRSGAVDWGQVALGFGVPLLIFAIVKSTSTRQP
jgi:hypothetical protein